jgi:hypothetical protein
MLILVDGKWLNVKKKKCLGQNKQEIESSF